MFARSATYPHMVPEPCGKHKKRVGLNHYLASGSAFVSMCELSVSLSLRMLYTGSAQADKPSVP